MAYSTLSDITKLLPNTSLVQLTDDENTGSVNQGRIDEAIAQADAEIDGYCNTRYIVPFNPVPEMIKALSVDIAIYKLYARKVATMPEVRKDSYTNAVGKLRDISRGIITIPGQSGQAAPIPLSDDGPEATTTADDRLFTRDSMSGY